MKSIGTKFAVQLAIGVTLITIGFGAFDMTQRRAEDTAAAEGRDMHDGDVVPQAVVDA